MKIRHFLLGTLGIAALASCNDYLEVDAPSSYTIDDVFGSSTEAQTVLNGVYATLLVNNAYGNALYNTLMLNSDVDFTANAQSSGLGTAPRRFDTSVENSSVNNTWKALYNGVETANEFIYNLEHSDLYLTASSSDRSTLDQMLGEAKVLRALCYDDIVSLWGDVPFSLIPTYITGEFMMPIVNRDTIRQSLIDDLIAVAPAMSFASKLTYGVEQVSKEACWAMIARLALNAGGYSLRPDGDTYGKMERPANYKAFYTTCRAYADSVISSATHSLTNSFQDVFVNECNFTVVNNDDPLFELPFAKESTGNWGYYQGPNAAADGGETAHAWGACSGSVGVSDFYRYTFDSQDLRRDFINGMWSYTAYNRPAIRANYTQYNNKWSKLWHETGLGKATSGSTGINFAPLRYTDVLLMFAEAENELKGPTTAAQSALRTVRQRAFASTSWASKVDAYIAAAAADKTTFLKAVLDERKWEFAGENMRWKDLVRNNLYNEVVYYSFLRYYAVAENSFGHSEYIDQVETYDNCPGFYQTEMPYSIYYCYIDNVRASTDTLVHGGIIVGDSIKGKYEISTSGNSNGVYTYFPNNTLPCLYLNSPYKSEKRPSVIPATFFTQNGLPYKQITQKDCDGLSSSESTTAWYEGNFYNWWNETDGCPNDYCLYSFYGYVRGVPGSSMIQVIKDGAAVTIDASSPQTAATLPVLRYLLPIPNEAISRSEGLYTQHYGY